MDKERDVFWKRTPKPLECWAALTRGGAIMPESIRNTPNGVKSVCGPECVPFKVVVTVHSSEE